MAKSAKRNSASSQKLPGAPRTKPKVSNNPSGSMGNVCGKPMTRSKGAPQGMK